MTGREPQEDDLSQETEPEIKAKEGDEMINQAQLRSAYATTRCTLLRTQFEFRSLLRDLLDRMRTDEAVTEQTARLRVAVDLQRKRLRRQLHDLNRIGQKARSVPGLLERAIEDAGRLYRSQG